MTFELFFFSIVFAVLVFLLFVEMPARFVEAFNGTRHKYKNPIISMLQGFFRWLFARERVYKCLLMLTLSLWYMSEYYAKVHLGKGEVPNEFINYMLLGTLWLKTLPILASFLIAKVFLDEVDKASIKPEADKD